MISISKILYLILSHKTVDFVRLIPEQFLCCNVAIPTLHTQSNYRSIFEQNHAKVAEHNAKYAAGQVSWYMKETEDMDLTEQEFLNKRTGKCDVIFTGCGHNIHSLEKKINYLLILKYSKQNEINVATVCVLNPRNTSWSCLQHPSRLTNYLYLFLSVVFIIF